MEDQTLDEKQTKIPVIRLQNLIIRQEHLHPLTEHLGAELVNNKLINWVVLIHLVSALQPCHRLLRQVINDRLKTLIPITRVIHIQLNQLPENLPPGESLQKSQILIQGRIWQVQGPLQPQIRIILEKAKEAAEPLNGLDVQLVEVLEDLQQAALDLLQILFRDKIVIEEETGKTHVEDEVWSFC